MSKAKSKTDPCQKEACQIQTCLKANNYQESKCEQVLQAMKKCCDKYGDESSCCAGFKHTQSIPKPS